jgi:hydrogenase expression/formation protein HypC
LCLAVPTKIIEIKGTSAVIEFGGVHREIGLQLVPDAKLGDFVLVHAGFAIQKLDEQEALETLRLLEEFIEVSE